MALYETLGEAYGMAAGELAERKRPGPGAALDTFVAAYARSHRLDDSPGFRQALHRRLAAASDPRMGDYWTWAAELGGTPFTPGSHSGSGSVSGSGSGSGSGPGPGSGPTLGASHAWLLAALAASSGPAPRGGGAG
ncbi:hypothetical protein [Streptomyces sp. NPDC012888]|uniref:hypothetical protein n=1 Tax=Streptomyces sp. NPDC012888 TaxID=3364855 RepID=UPI003689943C